MKKILLVLFIILSVYLNRAYAHIYAMMGDHNLPNPTTQKNITFPHKSSTPTLKYVALGDSLSAGVGSSSFKDSFPYLRAEKLARKNSVTLVNLALPGVQSADVLRNQVSLAILEDPQEITLFVGINDLHNLQSPEDFGKTYRQIILELKNKTSAQITLINLPNLGSDMLLYPPYNFLFDFRTRQFNKVITEIGQEENLKVIDLYDFTKEIVSKNADFYSVDEFHPSASGYKLWEQTIDAN
ncbi:MAG: SGNH/GDSL hydrolase family protein [bacterium]|nr:SGNH/GDSL hydrolase family protein [bacterium]